MARNDYQKMANAFLDLWQEQITRALNDSQFYDAMLAQMQQPFDMGRGHESAPEPSVAGDAELDAVYERLADCEARIVQLERQLARQTQPPRQPSAKKQPAKKKPAAKKPQPAPVSASRKPRKRAIRKSD